MDVKELLRNIVDLPEEIEGDESLVVWVGNELRNRRAQVESLQAAVTARDAELAEEKAKVERLTPLADDGKQYRVDVVTEALAEGVRAFGTEFAEETYRSMLEGAPLDTVKRMRDDWRGVADKLFPEGRQTTDEEEQEGVDGEEAAEDDQEGGEEEREVTIPASAYR